MNYKVWSVIRITLNFFAFLMVLFIFLFVIGLDAGAIRETGKFIGGFIPLLILLRLLLSLFRTPRTPKCSICKRELGETQKTYEFKKSKSIFDKLISLDLYDLYSIQEYRCHSKTCYPKNERLNGAPMIRKVLF
jgi:hypothetical protein